MFRLEGISDLHQHHRGQSAEGDQRVNQIVSCWLKISISSSWVLECQIFYNLDSKEVEREARGANVQAEFAKGCSNRSASSLMPGR